MKDIDFSCKHDVLLLNKDGSYLPMDVPYYEDTQIGPATWAVVSDGDIAYLVIGEKEAIVIDSGYGAGNLQKHMQTLCDVPVNKIANTHHHFDHSANNCYFDTVYMAAEGVPLATIPTVTFAGIDFPRDYHVEVIRDGDVLDLGGRTLEVMAMPDHAISSLLYLDRKERILFVGDELSNHGKDINTSVENVARQLERLMTWRREFDWMCGGSDAMVPAEYVDRYLANCRHILEGNPGKLMQPRGPRPEPLKGPNGETVYERKKPRMGEKSSFRDVPKATKLIMEYADCFIIYDEDKIFDKK